MTDKITEIEKETLEIIERVENLNTVFMMPKTQDSIKLLCHTTRELIGLVKHTDGCLKEAMNLLKEKHRRCR